MVAVRTHEHRRPSPAGAGQERRRDFARHDRPWTLGRAPGDPVRPPARAVERSGNSEPVVVLDEDIAAYQREARAMEEERALYRPKSSGATSDPWSDNAGGTEHDPGRPAASNEPNPWEPDVAANERATWPVDETEQRLHSLEGNEDTNDPWSDDESDAKRDSQVPVASNVPDPWGQDGATFEEQRWSDQEPQGDWTADDEGADAYAAALANVFDESTEHEAEEDDYNNALAALERLDAQRREAEEREAQRILELDAENHLCRPMMSVATTCVRLAGTDISAPSIRESGRGAVWRADL